MRLFVITALALLLITAAGLLGARGYGQREAWGPVLPLPDASGCWYGTCFTAVRQMDLRERLVQHPLVAQIGPQAGPTAYHVLVQASAAAAPRGIVIQTSPESTILSWDWSVQGNPPLMTLGDLVHTYGPPDRVDLDRQQGPTLWYVARNTTVVVSPAQTGFGWLDFAPGDPVTRITAYDPALAGTFAEVARDPYITTHDWHGFGTYVRDVE